MFLNSENDPKICSNSSFFETHNPPPPFFLCGVICPTIFSYGMTGKGVEEKLSSPTNLVGATTNLPAKEVRALLVKVGEA